MDIDRTIQVQALVSGQDVDQGGPCGYRHQINMADTGYGSRGPRVHNDRAGEVGLTLDAGNFDFDRIFGREVTIARRNVGAEKPYAPAYSRARDAIRRLKNDGPICQPVTFSPSASTLPATPSSQGLSWWLRSR